MSLSFRLAWRDLKAHKVSTILAILLFALPIAGILGVATAGNSAMTQVNEPLDRYSFVSMSMGTCGEGSLGHGRCIDTEQAHVQGLSPQERLAREFGDDLDFLPLYHLSNIEVASDNNQALSSVEAFEPPATEQDEFPAPGEVAIPTQLAFILDVEVGDTIAVSGQELTVISDSYTRGTLIHAADLPEDDQLNFIRWGTLTPQLPDVAPENGMWIDNSPAGRTDPTIMKTFDYLGANEIVPATLAGVMGLLLMVAIVGPIFAVSARRQRRTMGLISVSGGAPRVLKSILLWQAGIIAGIGGLLGLIVSAPLAWLVLTLFGFDSVRFLWPWDLAIGGWLFALVCAMAAALQPAIAAGRENPILALAGGSTQREVRFSPKMLIGPGIIVLGITIGIIGSQEISDLYLLITGIGVLLSGSIMVWAFSKISARLPLASRLAARDLMRQASRTAPGIAAIAGVVFIATAALSLPVTSSIGSANDLVMVSAQQAKEVGRNSELVDQVEEEIGAPHTQREDVFVLSKSEAHVELGVSTYLDWQHLGIYEEVVVSGPGILHAFPDLSEEEHAQAAAALDAGQGVVGTSGWGETLNLSNGESVDVIALDNGPGFGLLISPKTATSLGITPNYYGSVLIPGEPMSNLEQAWLSVNNGGVDEDLARVHVPGLNPTLITFTLAPIVASFLMAFAVVALIVYLSAAQSRRDLHAIWAVGAKPALLRKFTAGQGLIIATAGMLLGLAVGILASLPKLLNSGPVLPLVVLALGLPVAGWLAGLASGSFHRSTKHKSSARSVVHDR